MVAGAPNGVPDNSDDNRDDSAGNESDPSRKHIRSSALLLAGRFISLSLNLFTQILMVRYLTKEDFGAISYALPIIGLGVGLNWFGFTQSIGRFASIYHEKGDHQRLLGSVLLSLFLIIGLGAAVVLVVVGMQQQIQDNFQIHPKTLALLGIMIILMPIEALDGLAAQLLAAFSSARAIFFRRHIVAPGLRFSAVVGVIAFQGDVFALARCYVLAGVLGAVVYGFLLFHVFRTLGLLEVFRKSRPILPAEIVTFTLPLISSDLLFFLRITGITMLIEHWKGPEEIADYRAVTPMARMTTLVQAQFSTLFIPMAARLFARNEHDKIQGLYGQTTVWVTILTFPIFAAGVGLSEPMTVFLFGEKYRDASTIMAIMVIGNYAYAVLGFDNQTLKVLGRIRTIVYADVLSLIVCAAAAWILIPLPAPYGGAFGAAVAAAITLIFYRAINSFFLWRASGVSPFQRNVLKMFAFAAVGGGALAILQRTFDLNLVVGLVLAGAATLLLIRSSRGVLDVESTFPELLKLPGLAWILGVKKGSLDG